MCMFLLTRTRMIIWQNLWNSPNVFVCLLFEFVFVLAFGLWAGILFRNYPVKARDTHYIIRICERPRCLDLDSSRRVLLDIKPTDQAQLRDPDNWLLNSSSEPSAAEMVECCMAFQALRICMPKNFQNWSVDARVIWTLFRLSLCTSWNHTEWILNIIY